MRLRRSKPSIVPASRGCFATLDSRWLVPPSRQASLPTGLTVFTNLPERLLLTRPRQYLSSQPKRKSRMTSTAQHSQVVQKQFGEQAAAYLSSAVHAQGTEFALLQAELAGQGEARVLDLGCGAGHVSFQVAPLVKEVVAYDLSQQMLDVVAAAAIDRGLNNVATVNGAAERSAVRRWRVRLRVQPLFGAPLERSRPGPAGSASGAETGWRGGVHRRVVTGQPIVRRLPAKRRSAARHQPCARLYRRRVVAPGQRGRGCIPAAPPVSGCVWNTAPGSSACARPK